MSIDLPCSEAPRVSVIIVATSNFELLVACLRSVARFAPAAIPSETIVVLNEWSLGAENKLRAVATGVKVMNSPVNLGLAGAGNLGRSFARGDYLLLLHDDAEVEAGWMEALVQTADAHPEAGAIGGKVLHPDGRLQNAGMILWRDGYTSEPWIGSAPPPTAFDRQRAVDYCGTSSLLIRASAWDAVGGLDEHLYPVYYVDVDLSMGLRKLGFVVLYHRPLGSAIIRVPAVICISDRSPCDAIGWHLSRNGGVPWRRTNHRQGNHRPHWNAPWHVLKPLESNAAAMGPH